jgi:hypothetical protein
MIPALTPALVAFGTCLALLPLLKRESVPARFGVRFEENATTRIDVVRAFYAGEYVHAFRGVRAVPVGKAIVARLFK